MEETSLEVLKLHKNCQLRFDVRKLAEICTWCQIKITVRASNFGENFKTAYKCITGKFLNKEGVNEILK